MNTNRSSRKNIAADTLRILEQGYYTTNSGQTQDISIDQAFAVANTKLYAPEDSDTLLQNIILEPYSNTSFEVTKETTLDAVRRLISEGYTNTLCLNFASAKNPGGGFLGGSQAQEESIARATGLYPTQLTASTYYETNRNTKSCFYTDYMIYSPAVPILKDENGKLLDDYIKAAIITAPAVNTGVVKDREPHRLDEIEIVMKRRIEKVLAIAHSQQHKAIVLGAWGCGVFRNDPKDIAAYFEDILKGKYANIFEKIVFAVYANNERFIQPFKERFA